MITDTTFGKAYCNCVALQRGLDPVGHAGTFDDAIIIEAPLPWKRDMMQKADSLPQGMIDLLALWLQQYHETGTYSHRPLVVAPDPEYSKEGYRRVMFYTRPAGLFSQFEKVEYLVPIDELGSLVWSLYEDRASLPHFEPYRVVNADQIRDILVCTHGTIDVACAKFGYPLYKHMRDTYSDAHLRVWRVSHFGGHVFAPTLMDMPIGHYWAYVENEQAKQIIQREGDVADLRGHYRGWAGMEDSFQQTAECELWQQHGWAWFDYLKAAKTLTQTNDSENEDWADVQVSYAVPELGIMEIEMRVAVSHTIETPHSTDQQTSYAYSQYHVIETEKSS